MAGLQRRAGRGTGLRRWHKWLGLAVLLPLLVCAASGCLLVYQKPLIRHLVAGGASLPADYGGAETARDLDMIGARFDPETIDLLKAPGPGEPYWRLVTGSGESHLLAPVTLRPLTSNGWLLDTLAVARELHTVLLVGVTGEVVLFVTALVALFLTISGLQLWWPRRRALRWRLVLPTRPRPHLMLQYHRHAGAVLSLVLLPVVAPSAALPAV